MTYHDALLTGASFDAAKAAFEAETCVCGQQRESHDDDGGRTGGCEATNCRRFEFDPFSNPEPKRTPEELAIDRQIDRDMAAYDSNPKRRRRA